MFEVKANRNKNTKPYCAAFIHPISGETITKYKKLAADPATQAVLTMAFVKEWGNLTQGDNKTRIKGTDSLIVLNHEEIRNILTDRIITYANIVVQYCPQKEDPNRVRITAGGNLISYPGDLTTRTAELTTSKILWNSMLSTENGKYMCIDIRFFYLCTPIDRYEYTNLPLSVFPQHIKQKYDLEIKAKKAMSTSKCEDPYTAYHRPENSQTQP